MPRPFLPSIICRLFLSIFTCAFASSALAQVNTTTATNALASTNAYKIVLPPSVPDPLEPFNRGVWAFNRVLMTDVIKPTARGYRFVVRKPVRTSINNFTRNVTYPVRLLNNVLQGKWAGARHETDRFFCNTVVGAAGFVDVATKWNIPKSDADFGQTLGKWGWNPQCYLMLPLYGPSNERDAVGLAADTAANPWTYITPYPSENGDLLTYISPYSYYSYFAMYNNLSDSVDDYVRFSKTEEDPYSEIQYAWTFARKNKVADFQVTGQSDESSLETLGTIFFKPVNQEFPNLGKTRAATMPHSHREIKYTTWMQPKTAAIVYIVPGLGSHRLNDTALALAELVYSNGFSVVTISSPYNYEFMREASSVNMPAYTPTDAHDLQLALTTIHRKLEGIYPGRIGEKAVMGYSMGAFQSLFMAGSTNSPELIQFDRYVGINTPVRLLYGMSKLDEFYNAPEAWPADQRTEKIENTLLKIAALTKNSVTANPSSTATNFVLPFDGVESKFLVGLVFRIILRDTIYTSQARHNQHVLKQPITPWHRKDLYDEIEQYSYRDYFAKFVVPYYKKRGIDLSSSNALDQASNLRALTGGLRANPNIRLMVNRNDFLLPPEDLAWLQSTIPADHMHIFEHGGHLGNLSHPEVQKVILGMLDGLQPAQAKKN